MCFGTAAGRNGDRCQPLRSEHKEDADWLHDLPSSVPSLRATNDLSIEALKKKDWHEMCSDGYERNKTVLKKGDSDSRLVGSLDWPRRIRDLS
ncbi:BQ5605_C021g09323 [Microbotryum silenes-dioicae]|uniref:BQ5605_C021g09323 protein n=1 Tax=Microbotryum silenes-dioicae TaxID=796604 RepID=A0A2X0MKB9_9BASI|nr:BQ5605_C021g09323 [Microbotryum silenes-dioicae]